MPAGTSIADNINQVQNKIAQALARANRPSGSVRLLAVTKTVGSQEVIEAASCGLTLFGENRVQDAKRKAAALPSNLCWHFIGHLQRNKVRDAVQLFDVIHSVDSRRLMESLDVQARKMQKKQEVYVEVNVSGEETKHGLTPATLIEATRDLGSYPSLRVTGLMTMAPFTDDEKVLRRVFSKLRLLKDQINDMGITGVQLTELSMGMSNDYEIAIEEGATIVRVGSAIFK